MSKAEVSLKPGSAIRPVPGKKAPLRTLIDEQGVGFPASAMTDNDIKQICNQLNNTPRKCLGWKTLAEVFREKMMEELVRS